MMDTEAEETAPQGAEPAQTADELRSAKRNPNRNVALALIAVTLVFLGGAIAVALLVVYGPY